MSTYTYPEYPYVQSQDQISRSPRKRPVIIVGAGPVGLTAALDLATRGVPTLVLDDGNTVSVGSRAICYAKRTLEIWDRHGITAPLMAKGVTWNEGRVFYRDSELYKFNLSDSPDQKFPAFINLQQYHLEEALVTAADNSDLVELWWQHKAVGVRQMEDQAEVEVETPDGRFSLTCDYVLAADGAHSNVRNFLGLDFTGTVFQDHFLIADVVMKADFPKERWFWFDPPFNPGQSALLHMQADNVWRLDFQLGWDIDREEEKKPENVVPRIRRMLGEEVDFELEWLSIYTFQCRRLDKFRHGRVMFIGDSAHLVSPFGARGANSGVQDVDNLSWKLKLVVDGKAPDRLLDSYSDERVYAAKENLLHSTRATDFITPKGDMSKTYRNAVLSLANDWPFARALVNSGRLSTPATLKESLLNSYSGQFDDEGVEEGAPCPSIPVKFDFDTEAGASHLPDVLGEGFTALYFAETEDDIPTDVLRDLIAFAEANVPVQAYLVSPLKGAARQLNGIIDSHGAVARTFAAPNGSVYLFRPDQHVAARWRSFGIGAMEEALDRAIAKTATAGRS